jgi:hypothetical protein
MNTLPPLEGTKYPIQLRGLGSCSKTCSVVFEQAIAEAQFILASLAKTSC